MWIMWITWCITKMQDRYDVFCMGNFVDNFFDKCGKVDSSKKIVENDKSIKLRKKCLTGLGKR